MVEGDKPPKKTEIGSGSEAGDIDQYDSLLLHSNDTSGANISKNAKVVLDELEETYSKQNASVIFNMHFKIHSLSQSSSPSSEYYHKFNALWRQYDSFVNLPDCTCEKSQKSIILTTYPILDVKGAFATLSRDESHRSTQSHNVSKTGNGNTAFVARTNSRNNNWSNSNNNQFKRIKRPNLVCTHCNMNGHTANRCFELVRCHPNFKKKVYKRLMALISEKSRSSSMPANIVDVSKLNMTLGHPNVVPGYQDSILKTQVETGNESNGLYFLNIALGWLLEQIHVTWAQLEKKQTRPRLYTNYLEEIPNSSWRRRRKP
ncbi:hypothetical protein Tco_0987248 [Tanacetum coccineum]